jgi:hypothetical protein
MRPPTKKPKPNTPRAKGKKTASSSPRGTPQVGDRRPRPSPAAAATAAPPSTAKRAPKQQRTAMAEAANLVGSVRHSGARHANPRQNEARHAKPRQNEAPPRAPAAPRTVVADADALPTVGLINRGNTCYFNTTLQCLRACPSAVEGVLAAASTSTNRAVAELDRVFKAMSSGSTTPLDPSGVRRCLPQTYHDAGSTQCVHEVLTHLAQATTTCNCPVRCTDFTTCSSPGPLPVSFEVVTTVACTRCDNRTVTRARVETLIVAFEDPSFDDNAKAEHLQTMVTHLEATERLKGDNQYECTACLAKVDADRTDRVVTPPAVVVVQVRRPFDVTDEFGGRTGPVVRGVRQAVP